MKILRNLISILILLSCLISCSLKKREEQKTRVGIICLRNDDTLNIKIINKGKDTIYVPEEYNSDFTLNDDTLHLVTIHKEKFALSSYYIYKNIFPFEIVTTKMIEGHKPDEIQYFHKQINFFNQFRVRPFISITPGSFYIMSLKYVSIPKEVILIDATYYTKSFFSEHSINRFEYTHDDFKKFDSINAQFISTPILINYSKK